MHIHKKFTLTLERFFSSSSSFNPIMVIVGQEKRLVFKQDELIIIPLSPT